MRLPANAPAWKRSLVHLLQRRLRLPEALVALLLSVGARFWLGLALWAAGARLAAAFELGPPFIVVSIIAGGEGVSGGALGGASTAMLQAGGAPGAQLPAGGQLGRAPRDAAPRAAGLQHPPRLSTPLPLPSLAAMLLNLGQRREGQWSAYSLFNPGARRAAPPPSPLPFSRAPPVPLSSTCAARLCNAAPALPLLCAGMRRLPGQMTAEDLDAQVRRGGL